MTNNHVFSPSETKKAIEIRQLRKEFDGKLVLSDVFFDVCYGTIHGFVGPNGAGKSTTLNILVRLVTPTSGEVFVEGRSVADDPYFNESLGFVEAEPKFPDFTVEKYVKVCSYLRDVPKQEAWQSFINSSLNEFRYKKCNELSTGWKKFLKIFVASLFKPRVLILDEPFNGLDPIHRTLLTEQLIKVKREGRAVLFSAHNLTDIQKLSDDVTMIKNGRTVLTGRKPLDIEKVFEEYFVREEREKRSFSL